MSNRKGTQSVGTDHSLAQPGQRVLVLGLVEVAELGFDKMLGYVRHDREDRAVRHRCKLCDDAVMVPYEAKVRH